MKTKILIIFATLLLGMQAGAEFVTVSRAYEVALSDFRVPATPSGGATFRTCSDCDFQTVRVTPLTVYKINGKTLELRKFRERIFRIRDRAPVTVIVLRHLESDTIVSVSVTI